MDAHFVVVKGNPRGRTLKFANGEFLFGRGAECHVRPDSEWVSRQHCMLRIDDDRVRMKDLGSTNGTLVNGQRLVGERELVHGDTVQVGPLVLQLRLPSREAELDAMKQTDGSQSTVNQLAEAEHTSEQEPGLSPEESPNPLSSTTEQKMPDFLEDSSKDSSHDKSE